MSRPQPLPADDVPRMLTDERGTGPAVVLIGGGLTGFLSWGPHQAQMQETRRVVRAQLLSVQYGLDARPLPEHYSVRTESTALARALDGLGLDGPIDLVAWSYGALVTLDYALDHIERVRTLTLIEPPAFWVLDATGKMDEVSQREQDELEALDRDIRGDVTEAHLARFIRLAGLCPPDRRPEDLPSWPLWVRHRRSLLSGPAVSAHRDRVERLRDFDRPVLLVKGTGSTHAFHRIIDALAVTLPRAEMLELAGGHAPQIVEMDAFLRKLAAFQATGT